jgi:hypothetical protein
MNKCIYVLLAVVFVSTFAFIIFIANDEALHPEKHTNQDRHEESYYKRFY